MTGAFPESMVTGHEHLIEAMPNHEKDRHVAAATVKTGAQVVVTSNLKDFRTLPDGIEAQSPDKFLSNLFDLDPDGMVELVREQAKALCNPPPGPAHTASSTGPSSPRAAVNTNSTAPSPGRRAASSVAERDGEPALDLEHGSGVRVAGPLATARPQRPLP
jgi:hypothetical protein